jgi:hypothetical protein
MEYKTLYLRPEELVTPVANLVVEDEIVISQSLRNDVFRSGERSITKTEETFTLVIS